MSSCLRGVQVRARPRMAPARQTWCSVVAAWMLSVPSPPAARVAICATRPPIFVTEDERIIAARLVLLASALRARGGRRACDAASLAARWVLAKSFPFLETLKPGQGPVIGTGAGSRGHRDDAVHVGLEVECAAQAPR